MKAGAHLVLVLFVGLALAVQARYTDRDVRNSSQSQSQFQQISAFRSCLTSAGVDVNTVLYEYNPDPTSEYGSYNYQWELLTKVYTPAAYLVVRSAADVQAGVRCAKPLGIPLVPKGGGHSYEKYSYTHTKHGGEDTVVVDLQKLDQINVYDNAEPRQFSVGAGALLSQIAWPLYANYSLVTPHGTCPTVGIAGLALGGGYGYLSRLYGLTTDSILELEMVDAEGNLLTINRDSNLYDLFWAMKGSGSASFGIVTRLTLKAYAPPKNVVIGFAEYPKSHYAAVFSAWQRFLIRNPPKKINSKVAINRGKVIVEIFEVQLEDADGGTEGGMDRIRAYLDEFPTADVSVKYEVYNYPDFLMKTMHSEAYGVTDPSQFAHLTRHSNRPKRFKAKSFVVTQEAAQVDLEAISLVLEAIPVEEDIIIEVYAFGGQINDGAAISGSSFVHRNQALYLVQAFYEFRPSVRAQDIDLSLAWLRQFYGVSKSVMRTEASYQNYADGELDDYLQRYYGRNLQRLMEIKREVDPTNFFRGPQTIPLWA